MLTIQSHIKQFITPTRIRVTARVLALGLAVLAVWWLAQLTWQLLTPPVTVVSPGSVQVNTNRTQQSVDVNAIQRLNLFGDREQAAVQQVELDAPETALNIRLVGVTASGNPVRSAAIIEQAGNQQTYIIGERIANSRATLEAVYTDRVILDNSGRREALYLEGRDGSEVQLQVQRQTAAPASETVSRTQQINAEDNQELAEALTSLRADPTELLEFISVSPVNQSGRVTGYRLVPRQSPELFAAVGLEPGDIALAINGYDLTDTAQAMAAMNELQDATRAIVQVQRNNEIIDLELNVPSGQ